MVKCGACGKFLSSKALNDSMRCAKCPAAFHRACIPVAEISTGKDWICSGCGSELAVPREDTFSTPIKAQGDLYGMRGGSTVDVVSHGSNSGDLAHEIRLIREEVSAMRVEIRQYREEISTFKTALSRCLDQVSNVESRVAVLEQEIQEKTSTNIEPLEETILELKQQLNSRDQELLLNDVLVAGVPEQRGENLIHIIKLMTTKIGVNIQDTDVVHIERVGPLRKNLIDSVNATKNISADPTAHRTRAIAVRLARRDVRDNILRAARVRRTLTTTDLEMAGSQRRIYVNERLTHANYQLFNRARDAARRLQWRYTWSKEGKVFVKRKDGTPAFRILRDSDIDKIFGQ